MEQQGRWLPRHSRVALLTVKTKHPSVDFRFSVTLGTLSRRTSEPLVKVAVNTCDIRVAAIQRENHPVVKAMHTIRPVMAGQAIETEPLQVPGHKVWSLRCMTVNTFSRLEILEIPRMAGETSES
jgi:hypothetical protein